MRIYARRREDNRVARQRLVAKRFSHDIREHGGHLCQYCGKAQSTTIDHIYPIKRGGKDHLDNMMPACEPCNQAKGSTRLPLDVEEALLEQARIAAKHIKARYHERQRQIQERAEAKARRLAEKGEKPCR